MGIGIDLIEIERVEALIMDSTPEGLSKIFTQQEQAYCNRYKKKFAHFAGRWAAKEAIAKALGVGFGKELGLLDLEILPDHLGKPIASLSPKAAAHFGPLTIELSITHSNHYAAAVALIKS